MISEGSSLRQLSIRAPVALNVMSEAESNDLLEQGNIRRFALAVGLILLGFTLADGHILPEVHGGVLGVKFDRPWVLLLFLVFTSIYATYRYWYFAIKVPVSRTAIRRYLKQGDSILVFKGQEQAYKEAIMRVTDPHAHQHVLLEEKCPPGHTPFEFIIYTDALTQATDGYVRHLVANRVHDYFPGITKHEIATRESGDISLATVNKLKAGTKLRAFTEDADHWAPILINGVAIVAFVLLVFLPWVWSQFPHSSFPLGWYNPSPATQLKGDAITILNGAPSFWVLLAIALSFYYAFRGYKGNRLAWAEMNEKRTHKLSDKDNNGVQREPLSASRFAAHGVSAFEMSVSFC